MIDICEAEAMFGRRARAHAAQYAGTGVVCAVRNDAFTEPVHTRCGERAGVTVGQDQSVTCTRCARLLAADADRRNQPLLADIRAAEDAIRRAGYTLRYVDACEGDGVAGLIGMGVGVTTWDRQEVRIRNMLSGQSLLEVLRHELAHVEERPGYERGTHSLGIGGC